MNIALCGLFNDAYFDFVRPFPSTENEYVLAVLTSKSSWSQCLTHMNSQPALWEHTFNGVLVWLQKCGSSGCLFVRYYSHSMKTTAMLTSILYSAMPENQVQTKVLFAFLSITVPTMNKMFWLFTGCLICRTKHFRVGELKPRVYSGLRSCAGLAISTDNIMMLIR